MKKTFIGVIALSCLSPLAFANGDANYVPVAAPADAYTQNVYVGLQGGYGITGYKNFVMKKANNFAGRVFVGYDFHKNFAVEFGYDHFFAKPKANGTVLINDEYVDYSAKVKSVFAFDLMGKIKANVCDNFGVYAKAGVAYLHSKWSIDVPAAVDDFSAGNHHSFNLAYGVGVSYDFLSNWTADLSWNHINGNQKITSSNLQPYANSLMLGIAYKFNLS